MKMIRDELKGYCGEVEYRGTDGLLRSEGEKTNGKIEEQDAEDITGNVIYQMVDNENSIYEYDLNCMNKKKKKSGQGKDKKTQKLGL